MFLKHLSDSDLVWFPPMVERVVRAGALRYYMVVSDFTVIWPWAWGASVQSVGIKGASCTFEPDLTGWLRKEGGNTLDQAEGGSPQGSWNVFPTFKGRRLSC